MSRSLAATNSSELSRQKDSSEIIPKKDGFEDESYVGRAGSKRKVTISKASSLRQ